MRSILKKRAVIGQLLLIALAAFILILPQLTTRGMIMGSDAVFHFNRFYDTAMQIKEGNFQYFISMYGFQQTGRIVNAFYGPLIAYLQGVLVLLSPSWFAYQVMANFLLYLLSGISMYCLLKKAGVRAQIGVSAALIFMTTYGIQYWTFRQGFTSWGAALLPFCLIPAVTMVRDKKINPWALGICTALMFQTHLLSSVFLIMIYIAFFLYAFLASRDKQALLKSLGWAVLLFALLTLNIWYSLGELYLDNEILSPFVNRNMADNAVTGKSNYWLTTPLLLVPLIIWQLLHGLRHWREYDWLLRLSLALSAVFLVLSSNLIPWNWLVAHDFVVAKLIQFPFRFFVPATVLLLFSTAVTLQKYNAQSAKKLEAAGLAVVSLCLVQTLISMAEPLEQWQAEGAYIKAGKHTFVNSDDNIAINKTFFDSDLSQALKAVEKATPDYLPVYSHKRGNSYQEYEQLILSKNNNFSKKVVNGQLVVEWDSAQQEQLTIPVIVYKNTDLTLNDTRLSAKTLQLSALGAPTITTNAGKNRLVLAYREKPFFLFLLGTTLAAWLGCFGAGLLKIVGKLRHWCRVVKG